MLSGENEIIARIGRIISSTLDIEDVYERFAEEVHKLIPFHRIAIVLTHPEDRTARVAYVSGVDVPGRRRGDTFSLSGSATSEILRTKEGRIFQGETQEQLAVKIPGLLPAHRAGLRSMIMVPLITRNEAIGVLYLLSREANAYSEKELRLLEAVGDQIAGAIANAQLFAEHQRAEQKLKKAYRALKVICRCNHLMRSDSDESTLVRDMCRTIVEVGGYRMAWVGYAEQDEAKTVRPVAWAGCGEGYIESARITWADTERGSGAMGRAIRTGKPWVIKNMLTDPDCAPWREEAEKHGYASTIGIPLVGQNGTFGALGIYAAEPDAFDEEERELLVELGSDLAYGIEMLRVQAKKRQAEQALLESAQQWRTTFDAIQEAVALMDVDGRVLRCNQAMSRLVGRPFEEIVGHPCHEVVHGRKEPIPECPYLRMKETRQREYLILPMGERWFYIAADPILDEKGNVTGGVHIISDITEHKQSEKKMAAMEEQFRQSQKMEAVGRLAGGVAHDFNNLLTVIKGYSQLALFQLRDDTPLKESLKEVERASEKAADLIRKLLAFSRRQVMETVVLDLNSVLGDTRKMLRRMIGEDIELVMDLAEDLGRVKTDPGQVEQVVFNLAVNARDAMPKGGKLTIQTRNVELGPDRGPEVAVIPEGSYVMLSVADTGIGMSPEVKRHIFEPFFTTKERGKGTGLGLSTVYGIVKQSGGEILVESEPGKGATFRIYFPRVEEPLTERKEKVEEELPRGSETILVVEDEEEVRRLAVRILRKQGYDVLEAPQAGDALLTCEQHEGPIHLLLTDVVMPRMSGPDLAKRLRSIRPEMKVLYMSGYADNALFQERFLKKDTNFIQKPFALEALVRKVREVLDEGGAV